MPTSPMSVRLPAKLKQRLAKLAKETDRSQSWHAEQAIEEYVSLKQWQIDGVKEAIASADRGELVPHDEVMAGVRDIIRRHKARKK